MYELLKRTAERDGDQVALIQGEHRWTFAELLEAARRTTAGLRERGISRFGVIDEDPAHVLALLAAASQTGAEACVYPPTAMPDEVADMAARFDHTTLVTSRAELAHIAEVVSFADLGVAADEVDGELPAERPHLVLTTGTTGKPRAARHDWWPLVKAIDLPNMRSALGQRWLLAYGLNQFGGLQILMHAVNTGATLVGADAFTPRAGLAAMRAHDVTHASATPTYWRFLLAELAADGGPVPPLAQITLGGEATTEQLLDRLQRTFPAGRITQIYGANEYGKNRSVRDNGIGLPLSTLTEDPDIEFKVEDGQLWVRSDYAMRGYYGEEPLEPGAWRATGDLVEVVGDRVFFRGRRGDVINVGGVKVHPLQVEQRLAAIPGIEVARVFGRRNPLTGSIVAVEAVLAEGYEAQEVDAAIRAACSDLPAAARPRSIRFVDSIETRDNKIIRRPSDDRQEQS